MSTVQSATDTSIRPFQVNVPEAELEDLRRRIAATNWPELDRGGHFAAWEEPELFSAEVRAAFRSLRSEGGRHE